MKAKQIMLSSCCFILSFIINGKYNLHGSRVSRLHVKHFFCRHKVYLRNLLGLKKTRSEQSFSRVERHSSKWIHGLLSPHLWNLSTKYTTKKHDLSSYEINILIYSMENALFEFHLLSCNHYLLPIKDKRTPPLKHIFGILCNSGKPNNGPIT